MSEQLRVDRTPFGPRRAAQLHQRAPGAIVAHMRAEQLIEIALNLCVEARKINAAAVAVRSFC
ncbi:hypothetical protein [Burkholderia stagnalis]|uniref:hypothetical protein n=1 Tax=Burkholderia stagnalis TaxID=1503054 RepID=UPI000F803F07|nr:hypothetical protein [Burkholderia stagnalis]